MLPLLLALAGTVRVETRGPAELRMDGQPVLGTWGAATVALPGVPAGPRRFQATLEGRQREVVVDVPSDGTVRLVVSAAALAAEAVPDAVFAPTVQLEAMQGQSFALVVDGARLAAFHGNQPVRLEGLSPGDHKIELRRPDLSIVWVRGTLSLQPADHLTIRASEGRMIEVTGREGAWLAEGSEPVPPPPGD